MSVEFHSLAEIVSLKWIHVHQTNVAMELDVRQVQTIKISIVHVQLVTLEVFVMKTSMNVNFQLHLVEMEQHVEIPTDLINACVLKDMKEKIVRSIPTIVLRSHVKMVELVLMESVIILACVMMDLKENIAKLTSMNVCRNLV